MPVSQKKDSVGVRYPLGNFLRSNRNENVVYMETSGKPINTVKQQRVLTGPWKPAKKPGSTLLGQSLIRSAFGFD